MFIKGISIKLQSSGIDEEKQMNKKITKLLLSMILAATVFVSGCQSGGQEADTNETPGTADGAESQEETPPGEESTETSAAYPVTVTDSYGNEITIEQEPERIISLTPANTEILFAIGAGDRLVGRTDYCNYPEEASEVESIGNYWTPNAELIISKDPDVIFTEYLEDSVKQQIEAAGTKVISYTANSIVETEDLILLMGQVLNLNENARTLADSMEEELAEVQVALAPLSTYKSVFLDLGDYYSAGPGSLLDDVLNRINTINIAAEGGETWPQLSLEVIIEKNPDIYLSMHSTPEELAGMAGISALDCIKNGNIVYIEENSPESDLVSRPGPRIVEGVRLLAEKIYPERFQ